MAKSKSCYIVRNKVVLRSLSGRLLVPMVGHCLCLNEHLGHCLCNGLQVEDAALREVLGRAASQLYEALALQLDDPAAEMVLSSPLSHRNGHGVHHCEGCGISAVCLDHLLPKPAAAWMHHLYMSLSRAFSNSNEPDNNTDLSCYDFWIRQMSLASQMHAMLDGAPCIWAGAGFVVATDAALATPTDFAPYLHSVPPDLVRHKDLLVTLGVCDLCVAI